MTVVPLRKLGSKTKQNPFELIAQKWISVSSSGQIRTYNYMDNVVRLTIIFMLGYTSPIFGMRSRNHSYYRDGFE
jgi:hypothetical protein